MLLSYPDFNQPFEIHTDTSHNQLGVVISQKNKPIAFYSRKLWPAQRRHTTTEHELLSIIKTLRVQKHPSGTTIVVYSDHKNLTYKNFNMEHIMRWQILIKEFGPTIEYIKGPKNIIANVLSRLDLVSSPSNVQDMVDCYGLDKDDLPSDAFQITHQLINCKQQKDKTLFATINQGAKHYTLQEFHGGGRSSWLLSCYKDRIMIPQGLQKRVVQWFHHTLCHPGINQTEETISQHFYWKNMREHITGDMSMCSVYQKQKKQHKKYELLTEKEAEYKPWEWLCVDLISPYKIRMKKHGHKIPELRCVMMINPASNKLVWNQTVWWQKVYHCS